MREANVLVEEVLLRKVSLQVPDDVKDEDVMEWAENEARRQYKAEEIVLDADDLWFTRLATIDHNDNQSDWVDM